MVNVIVAGVPKNLTINKFIEFLESKIFHEKIKVSVNYLRWYKRDLKKISLNLRSNDARKAVRCLNGYDYLSRRSIYTLGCWEEDSEDISDNGDVYEPHKKMIRTSIPFDESDELQVIDRKIELIRKQRILLEEESQLLLEKKKLEMIQNLGPNDFQKLCRLEEMIEIDQSITETKFIRETKKSPDLQGPWNIIFFKMKSVINTYVDDQDRPIFIDLLRSRVKNRLAPILKDKGYLKAKEILSLYRNIYPEENDVNLIKEVLMKIKECVYPINIISENNIGVGKKQDTPSDETDANGDSDDDENTGLNDTQNKEMEFYEDVKFDNIKHDISTTRKKLDIEINQCIGRKVNDENIHIIEYERNIFNTDHQIQKNKMLTETNMNEYQKSELNEITQGTHLNINKEISINESEKKEGTEETLLNINKEKIINESEFGLATDKEVEPALNEAFDIDNDLDDWVEDEKDGQQETS